MQVKQLVHQECRPADFKISAPAAAEAAIMGWKRL